ncbi:pesticidal protein Cry7Aa [Candidatus Woesearchaeota archaeon]|nr:pesticidal protein Cry7Aa [Candidatus Woesearchaeota archaeon]
MEKLISQRKLVLEPSHQSWESGAVLNPTAIKKGETVHIIYRAVKKPNFSSLGHLEITKKAVIRKENPLLTPSADYEKQGIEDPRVTFIDGKYYLVYTAFDGNNARVALAVTDDLLNFEKKGIISPNIEVAKAIDMCPNEKYKNRWQSQVAYNGPDSFLWDKDCALFPEKINGKFAMLNRFLPDIQIVYFDKFEDLMKKEFWTDYIKNIDKYLVLEQKQKWEERAIGAGPVPIKTDKGWLIFYHGVDWDRKYRAGVALLDLQDPQKVIGRFKKPLFEAKFQWETLGDVPNVVFPEGAVLDKKGKLDIFYGCSDSRIGMIKVNLQKLLRLLEEGKR